MSLLLVFAGAGRGSGSPAVPEIPSVIPTPSRASTVPLDEGNYLILGPASARIVIRSPRLVLGRRSRDDEAASLMAIEL
jgi:hypothetical protein